MARDGIVGVLDRPDQGRVRADLAIFFGPQADTYLRSYEKMRSASSAWRRTRVDWSWPAFLTSFVWFFYRKMYLHGIVIVLLPVLLGQVIDASGAGTIIAIILARYGKGIYVDRAVRCLAAADDLGLESDKRSEYLRRAGGVSLIAAALATLVYACMLAFAIADLSGAFAQ